MTLKKLVDTFIKEANKMELMTDSKIRNPPSKHQRIIRELYDLVKGFEHEVNNLKHEGKME